VFNVDSLRYLPSGCVTSRHDELLKYRVAPIFSLSLRGRRNSHDSHRTLEYSSEKEVWAVLSDFGISEETIASHLKLLAQMGANEQLNFPPIDVPQHELLSNGFRLK